MAQDVHQLVSALKLERVYIVGHAIGGMVSYAAPNYRRLQPLPITFLAALVPSGDMVSMSSMVRNTV